MSKCFSLKKFCLLSIKPDTFLFFTIVLVVSLLLFYGKSTECPVLYCLLLTIHTHSYIFPGYSGNGFSCVDINECAVNNGGCSMSPMVDCINTAGSRECGPCPEGMSQLHKFLEFLKIKWRGEQLFNPFIK